MSVFIVKVTNEINVKLVQSGQGFTHEGIYDYENDINIGSTVFIYFSGWKTQISWDQGLAAVGRVTKGPYDKGYSSEKPRNFKIDIQPLHVFQKPISHEFLATHPKYTKELYEVEYVGGKHFRNQAIGRIESTKGLKALCDLCLEVDIDSLAIFDELGLIEDKIGCAVKRICEYCQEYNTQYAETRQSWSISELKPKECAKQFSILQVELTKFLGLTDRPEWEVQYSIGQGLCSFVPWILIRQKGQKASEGIYVGSCFGYHGDGLVAGVQISVTNPPPGNNIPIVQRTQNQGIDVNSPSNKPNQQYNDSFYNPEEFYKATFSTSAYIRHLRSSLVIYQELLASESKAKIGEDVLCDDVLVKALVAKPFVIISGASGTGKTRSAVHLARALDYELELDHSESMCRPANCLAFVPVGAGWTDDHHILGYRNPFGVEREISGTRTNLSYELTDALLLMLRASHPNYCEEPHFLVLDEMNLSHVERYFSRFLSVLEADRSSDSQFDLVSCSDLRLIAEILRYDEEMMLGSHPVERDSAEKLTLDNKGLSLPKNLFIIGTVNVDETTYMFSPKVLDRAHVIELQAESPKKLLDIGISGRASINHDVARILLRRAATFNSSKRNSSPHPDQELRQTLSDLGCDDDVMQSLAVRSANTITSIFDLLEPIGFGFGNRVTIEVYYYIRQWLLSEQAKETVFLPTEEALTNALDRSIFQKILPKLHGNRRQLSLCLQALGVYFGGNDASYTLDGDQTTVSGTGYSLPDCQRKVGRMRRTLASTGYTSFIS